MNATHTTDQATAQELVDNGWKFATILEKAGIFGIAEKTAFNIVIDFLQDTRSFEGETLAEWVETTGAL